MKTALITGASSGIGHELALELSRRGWRVALLARRREALEELAASIAAAGGEADVFVADVTDPGAVTSAVRELEARRGSIELAVANAGVGPSGPFAKIVVEQAHMTLRTNVEGTLNLMTAVLPGMLERRAGHIVGIASLAGFRGLPGGAVYSASKAAMRSLLEAARVELAPKGILVTTINPGFIRTAMTASNRFRMPFLLDVDDASRRIADAIEARTKEYSFPFPMALAVRVGRLLPNAIWDRLTLPAAKARAKRG
jgi:short-subunit dehydrogenase